MKTRPYKPPVLGEKIVSGPTKKYEHDKFEPEHGITYEKPNNLNKQEVKMPEEDQKTEESAEEKSEESVPDPVEEGAKEAEEEAAEDDSDEEVKDDMDEEDSDDDSDEESE